MSAVAAHYPMPVSVHPKITSSCSSFPLPLCLYVLRQVRSVHNFIGKKLILFIPVNNNPENTACALVTTNVFFCTSENSVPALTKQGRTELVIILK